jgi:hypothetical protein
MKPMRLLDRSGSVAQIRNDTIEEVLEIIPAA